MICVSTVAPKHFYKSPHGSLIPIPFGFPFKESESVVSVKQIHEALEELFCDTPRKSLFLFSVSVTNRNVLVSQSYCKVRELW